MKTRSEANRYFADLGCTAYLESFYPPTRGWSMGGWKFTSRLFSIHYFKEVGGVEDTWIELGYVIPDVTFAFNDNPQLFPEQHGGREWPQEALADLETL